MLVSWKHVKRLRPPPIFWFCTKILILIIPIKYFVKNQNDGVTIHIYWLENISYNFILGDKKHAIFKSIFLLNFAFIMALKSILVSSFFPLCKDLFYISGRIFKLPRILVFNDHNKYFFRSDHATHNCYLINYLSNSHTQIEAPVFFSQKLYQQVCDMNWYIVNHFIYEFNRNFDSDV